MRSAFWADTIDPKAESLIRQHPVLTPRQLMAIYRGSILGGFAKALAEAYPVCRRLVGERFFEAMIARYVRRHPSHRADLNTYGASLGDFIADFEPAADLPYLADVARLEWAWHRAWYSPPHASFDLSGLDRALHGSCEDIRFRLAHGSTLLESVYPIARIWSVNQDGHQADSPVNLAEGGVRLLIWSKDGERRIDRLDEAQWILLSQSARGRRLIELWEPLQQTGVATGRLLGDALAKGWIAGFDLGGTP